MCQVEEDYRDPLLLPDLPSVVDKCVKCKDASAAVVVRAGDPYCRACFKDYFIHKFRAMLGKNRVIFPGEKVLLAVSGGPSSSAMLRQVQEGLSHNAHKKLRFSPGIVYVDEGGAVGRSAQERLRTASELQEVFRATGFPFHVVPLEQVLDLPSSVVTAAAAAAAQPAASAYKAAVDRFMQSEDTEQQQQQQQQQQQEQQQQQQQQQDDAGLAVLETDTLSLRRLLDSATTLTAREELLSTLRCCQVKRCGVNGAESEEKLLLLSQQHVLVHTARSQGYSKLMLGDSCSRLAVKLLAAIALGRGAQLAQDTGFSDCRYGDVVCVKPMRDYSAKEIAFYNHMFRVPSALTPSLTSKMSDKASIQRLTESFISKLQADFPSTVSTIYRTSEKLQTSCRPSSAADGTDTCLLCVCALDTSVGNATAFQSTLISKSLSESRAQVAAAAARSGRHPAAPPCVEQSTSCGGGRCGSGACTAATRSTVTTDLQKLLCYSCQLTLRDMSSVDRLPQYVLSEAQRRTRRCQLREEISDFLLDDDEDDSRG